MTTHQQVSPPQGSSKGPTAAVPIMITPPANTHLGVTTTTPPCPRFPTTPIANLELLKPLSSGAFGTVYLGRRNGTVYAVKVLQKSDLIRKNMTAQVSQERLALVHSNKSSFCVNLYYSLQTHEHVYFVMEYCIGGDLKALLRNTGFFQVSMAAFYVAEVATALDYLHGIGIIHRDIKPDNMLVDKNGHVKLTDFGLSDVGVKAALTMERGGYTASPGGRNCIGKPYYTPGMIDSLGQNITFAHCRANMMGAKANSSAFSGSPAESGSPSSCSSFIPPPLTLSPVQSTDEAERFVVPCTHSSSSASTSLSYHSAVLRTPNLLSVHPIQHSTPVGVLGTVSSPRSHDHSGIISSHLDNSNPIVNVTKHRKIRIPLRKLGSRGNLGLGGNSNIITAGSSTNTSHPDPSPSGSSANSVANSWSVVSRSEVLEEATSNSSWSIISQSEVGNTDLKGNEIQQQQAWGFKRVKVSSGDRDRDPPPVPFNFDTSSYICVDFAGEKSGTDLQQQQLDKRLGIDRHPPPRSLSLGAAKQCIQNAVTPTTTCSSREGGLFHSNVLLADSGSEQDNNPGHRHRNNDDTKENYGHFFSTSLPAPGPPDSRRTSNDSLHRASPEKGRFRREFNNEHTHFQGANGRYSTNLHNSYSMPVYITDNTAECFGGDHHDTRTMMRDSVGPYHRNQQSEVLVHHQLRRSVTQPCSSNNNNRTGIGADGGDTTQQQQQQQQQLKSPVVVIGSWLQEKEKKQQGVHVVKQNDCATPPSESKSTGKKRKRGEEENQHVMSFQAAAPLPAGSTGLTEDVSALLRIGMINTHWSNGDSAAGGRTCSPQFHSTPVGSTAHYRADSQGTRLLGTPDYLAPELIKHAMGIVDYPAGSDREIDMVAQDSGCARIEGAGESKVSKTVVTSASDWWSLGVCLYEFVLGLLPFNDDSPEAIFRNILDRGIEYPAEEGLDPAVVALVDGLVCTEPSARFKLSNLKEPRFQPVFGAFIREDEDWGRLSGMVGPWIPVVQSETDTAYFGM